MFYYFLFICTLYLGFFKLPVSYPSLIYDILFIPLIIYSFLSWKKSLKNDRVEKLLIFSWGVFVIYYLILLVSTEKYLSKITSILNIRLLYPYILFYITIAVVNTKQKLIKTIKFLLMLSIVASLITIIQSVYGPDPMFNPEGFYNIGHWAGQGNLMIGPIARVLLPTMYLIYITFIALIIYNFLTNKINYLLLLFVLAVSILISFTRSFWLATAIAIFLTVNLLIKNLLIKKGTFYISFILILIIIGLISFLMSLDNPVSISMNGRFISIFEDIHNNSGTYGIRLINTQRYLEIWQTQGVFLGVDPFFLARFDEPALSDVGFVYVLVTIGLTGIILLIIIWILGIRYAVITLKEGVKTNKIELAIIGAILFASIIFFIICQVYTQYEFTSSLFALIFGLSVASKRILND